MEIRKITLAEKSGAFHERWRPKLVGEASDAAVELAQLAGAFERHHHEGKDELPVIKDRLIIKLRDQPDIALGEGVIIPRGARHLPGADELVRVLLFEPKTALTTGNVSSERTPLEPERT